jgi:DNA mismatch repair protein MutS
MPSEMKLTPAMRQWQRVKDAHPDKIVLFRMGDFYEMFGPDALVASDLLEIALTTRDRDKADPIPMCGIPHHALEGYLGRLIRAGHKVALCDQVENPAQAKGIVRREVTRVVTPGTALEEGVVEAGQPVFLAAWNAAGARVGVAWTDLSSGEVVVWQSGPEEAVERLRAVAPAELLHPESADAVPEVGQAANSPLPDEEFAHRRALERLTGGLGLPPGLPGLPGEPEPLGALSALLAYLKEQGVATLKIPRYETPGTFLAMDEATRRNLELVAGQESGGRRGSLLQCLDATLTPMGARLLREWLLTPCADRARILARQSTVAAWMGRPAELAAWRSLFRGFPDLGRLVARFAAGIASPRDAGGLRAALQRLPEALALLRRIGERSEALEAALPQVQAWGRRLAEQLEETLPTHAREGGIFALGFLAELDRLRSLSENAHDAILQVEARERARTGIGSLKIRYNRVFGYFIEVSKANLSKVPPDYERRQTLVNAERFVTAELRALEGQILSARAERYALEERLWGELVQELAPALPLLREVSGEVAAQDILAGFAHLARERGYVRPLVVEEPVITLEEARHPLLELDERHRPFVPNPVEMDTAEKQVTLLTGPNMGGKSTYLRQTALLAVMAHVGSWVPAKSATVGLVDRLYCRVGAGDSLLRGLSTFMVEMTETAAILRGATVRSLVLLDEVGRGTSTYDGLAIAWAVVEALRGPEGIGCRTLFATHYHELTELGRTLPGVRNLTMAVREYAGTVHFLKMVEPGAADKSYGIHVAELAGVPPPVVSRAREVLERLERRREQVDLSGQPQPRPRQSLLFSGENSGGEEEVLAALRQIDPHRLTPLEALLLLERLKRKLS